MGGGYKKEKLSLWLNNNADFHCEAPLNKELTQHLPKLHNQ